MNVSYRSSFEEGFYEFNGESELTCPNEWKPAWKWDPHEGTLDRPEYKPKDIDAGEPEVRTGRFAANFYTSHATHNACLYRKFTVGSGSKVKASVWCMGVTHDNAGGGGGLGMRVGIDPTGGVDHTASTVEYSLYWSSHLPDWRERQWRQRDVEVTAEADEITVFLHAQCDWPVDINASHWDDFALDATGGTGDDNGDDTHLGNVTLAQLEALLRRVIREELNP
jgi:hypothetical protein